jgi:acyl-CoA reductase-like NAD-dependent aldehyde dehydrogenase
MSSKYLTSLQIKGILRTGDVIIPGEGKFPRFSDTLFINDIDLMLDYLTDDDREGLCMLMGFFALMPSIIIRFILALAEKNANFPNILGAPLRMVQMGVKGLIFTLYYSNIDDEKGDGKKIHNLIGWDAAIRSKTDEDSNDVESEPFSSLEDPTVEQVKNLYEKSVNGRKNLNKYSLEQRIKYITKLKEVILEHKEEIIDSIQQDAKKTRSDALISEIFGVLDHLDYLEKNALKVLADQDVKSPLALMGKKSQIFFNPVGTVLIISPWNYPFYQAIVPITTSFIVGNSTIYKPSEFTPLKGLVEKVLKRAGFQKDWVQIVYGDGLTGKNLIDQRPDKIFFTGSVNTGKKIMSAASDMLIPVELELGGKDPMIVFEDANIERSAAGAVWGALTNTGQSCTSVERIYIQEEIYDSFKYEVLKQVKKIKQKVNDKDGDADIGAMTTQTQVQIVKEHLEDALQKGATLLLGSEWDKSSELIPPLVFENLTPDMKIVSEETFGPIIPLFKFQDETHAIELANNSDFGLSASVWSKDKERAVRVARALDTGNVTINNVMLTEGNHYLPFGGTKQSGIGRYKGSFGLHAFSNIKAILIDSDSSNIEANWYPYTKKKYKLFSKLTDATYTSGVKSLFKFAYWGLQLESYSNKAGKSEKRP